MSQEKILALKEKIKAYADFPKKDILFRDIFSALAHGPSAKLLKDLLVETVKSNFPNVEAIVGLESRGFLFCFSIATELGIGCYPIRKKGKLPGDIKAYRYQLEYGSDTFEIQTNYLNKGMKCIIVDDLIATGGSLNAAIKLLQDCDVQVLGCLLAIELTALNGRQNIPSDIPVVSLVQYD